jgi:chaperonin cofactor prefoldin
MPNQTQRERYIDNLGHGLSHTEGQLLSINNLIKELNLKKQSLEKEIKTIESQIEDFYNE